MDATWLLPTAKWIACNDSKVALWFAGINRVAAMM
jgi:hypothetical protein